MALQTGTRSEQVDEAAGAFRAEPPLTLLRWLAAVAVGLAGLCVTALLVRHVELVTGRYVSSGVPPVPAVAVLLALVALRPLLRRLPRPVRLDRGQILIAFSMLCVGTVLNGQYVVRAFLPHLVTLQYWSKRYSGLGKWTAYLPPWYAPADNEAIRRYFEGGGDGRVPWHLWAVPLARWSLLFAALFSVAWSLAALFRRHWLRSERLSFPLLYLPLSLTANAEGAVFAGRPLFRHPLLWGGIALAALWNGVNVGHVLNPAIPAPGFSYSFAGQFPDRPWTPFNTLMLFFMLEAVGFGYFLPLEISFSAWFFYLVEKLLAVGMLASGDDAPGVPYMMEQSAGAYLGVAGLVVYGARRHLAGVLRQAFGFRGGARSAEDDEERAALFVLLGALAFALAWVRAAGFSLSVAAPFLGILLCFILVYARIRAETGVPFAFIYPYGLPREMLVDAWTARGVIDAGGARSWVLLSSLAWLSRHHYAEEMAAYQIDGMKLAEEARVHRRWLYGALVIAFAAGLALAFWSHLGAYYAMGSNLAGGGTGEGEYRAKVALQEYQQMAAMAVMSPPRDPAKLGAIAAGAAFAVFLGGLRTAWVRSPFHPLGFILATAYGDHTTMFFPLLIAWFCKAVVLKLGGLPLYRRGIPFFLGLIIGHYSIAGVLWPLFSLILGPEASRSYHVYFGG